MAEDPVGRLQQIALELTKTLIDARMRSEPGYRGDLIPKEAQAVAEAFDVIYKGVCATAMGSK